MRSKITDDVYDVNDLQTTNTQQPPGGDFDQLLNDGSALLDFMVSNDDFLACSLQGGPIKVSCCIAGCNVVTYGPIQRNSTLRKLNKFPRHIHVIFATYLQNVITSPCKMANSDIVIIH